MKRTLVLLLAIVMCLPLFIACGPDESSDESSKAPTTTGSAVQNTQPVTTGDGTDDSDEPTDTTAQDFGFEDVAKNDWNEYTFKVFIVR